MDSESNIRIQKEIKYHEESANQKFDPEHYPTPYEPGLYEWSGWVDTQNPGIEGNGSGETKTVKYYEGFHFNFVTFILALILVGATVFLLFPWIIFFLFSF